MGKHEKTLREIMGLRDSIGDIRLGDAVRIVSGGHVGRVEMIGQHGLLKISGMKPIRYPLYDRDGKYTKGGR